MDFSPTGFVSSAARGCSGKPKPAANLPAAATTRSEITAGAGEPAVVVFGTVTVKKLASLWYGKESFEARTVCK